MLGHDNSEYRPFKSMGHWVVLFIGPGSPLGTPGQARAEHGPAPRLGPPRPAVREVTRQADIFFKKKLVVGGI